MLDNMDSGMSDLVKSSINYKLNFSNIIRIFPIIRYIGLHHILFVIISVSFVIITDFKFLTS